MIMAIHIDSIVVIFAIQLLLLILITPWLVDADGIATVVSSSILIIAFLLKPLLPHLLFQMHYNVQP